SGRNDGSRLHVVEAADLSAAAAIMDEVLLTILMPCLDEARTLPSCIRKAQAFLSHAGIQGEVLVTDNGSIDGSREIAEALGATVLTITERGYGNALRA